MIYALDQLGHYMVDCSLAPYLYVLNTIVATMVLLCNYVSYIHYYLFLAYVYSGNILFNNSFFGCYLAQFFGPNIASFKMNIDDITYNVFLNCLNSDTGYIVNILSSYFQNNTPSDFMLLPYFGNLMFCEESEDLFEGTFLANFNDFFSNFEVIFYHPITNFLYNIFVNIFFSFIFLAFCILFAIELIISEYKFIMSSNKNLDSEHLANQLTVESEKEVSSFDDILPIFLVVFLTLG